MYLIWPLPCVLSASIFYSVCGDEEHPEDLREALNDGIEAVNRLFE
jgi:hypothetical protein